MYQANTGDVADPTYRNQQTNAVAGNYLIDGGGVSIADSTTSVKTTVEQSVLRFGNEIVVADQQTLTHPDGDPADPRLDAITIDNNGNAGRTVGTPAPADPPNRQGQRVRTPTPPDLSDTTTVCVAFVWVPAGLGSSAEMYNDWIIPRDMPGGGLNDLDLIPGRDLQYVLDSAREGETLRGDKSQTVTTAQPLTVNTPGVTIRDLTLRADNSMAVSDTDDLLTINAEDVTVENVTLLGNKRSQNAEPDGITVLASNTTLRSVSGVNHAGHLVNVNGGSREVRGTVIDSLVNATGDKDALIVQGDDAIATRARNVRSDGAGGSWGTVTVRNGPNETTLEDIRGSNQDRVLHFEDFGPQTDESAAVQNVTVNGLKASGTRVAVSNNLSPEITHADITLSGISVAGITPGDTDSVVGLAGIKGVRVLNSSITGSFTAGRGIALSVCSNAHVSGNRIEHSTPIGRSNAAIYATNSTRVTCANNTFQSMPSHGISINSSTESQNSQINITGTQSFDTGEHAIRVAEGTGGGTMDRVMIIGNPLSASETIYVDITGTKQTLTNNFGSYA